MKPKQEEALRDYLRESIVPLIEDVLTKKLGQAITFAKEELTAPVQEPVAYQQRTRPNWKDETCWTPWEDCSKSEAEDCWNRPQIHDWLYEARALYTTPPAQEFVCSTGLCHYKPAAQPAPVPLTDDEIWNNDDIMVANSRYGADFETLLKVIRAIEAAHGITKGQS